MECSSSAAKESIADLMISMYWLYDLSWPSNLIRFLDRFFFIWSIFSFCKISKSDSSNEDKVSDKFKLRFFEGGIWKLVRSSEFWVFSKLQNSENWVFSTIWGVDDRGKEIFYSSESFLFCFLTFALALFRSNFSWTKIAVLLRSFCLCYSVTS